MNNRIIRKKTQIEKKHGVSPIALKTYRSLKKKLLPLAIFVTQNNNYTILFL